MSEGRKIITEVLDPNSADIVAMMLRDNNIEFHVSLDHLLPAHNLLKDVDSGWDVTFGPNEATCHTRMVGGVMCRWWGDGPAPSGVHLINAAIELRAAQGRPLHSHQQPAAVNAEDRASGDPSSDGDNG